MIAGRLSQCDPFDGRTTRVDGSSRSSTGSSLPNATSGAACARRRPLDNAPDRRVDHHNSVITASIEPNPTLRRLNPPEHSLSSRAARSSRSARRITSFYHARDHQRARSKATIDNSNNALVSDQPAEPRRSSPRTRPLKDGPTAPPTMPPGPVTPRPSTCKASARPDARVTSKPAAALPNGAYVRQDLASGKTVSTMAVHSANGEEASGTRRPRRGS